MKTRIALLAYIDAAGIENFFPESQQGVFDDWALWTYKIGENSKEVIREELANRGELGFYVYISEGPGTGAVKVLAYFDDFQDATGEEDYQGMPLLAKFHFTRYHWLEPPLELTEFVNWNTDNPVQDPSWLRQHYLYVVDPLIKGGAKTYYQFIREAVESIGGKVKYSQIISYVLQKQPSANQQALRSVIRAYTVNNENRIKGYPENQHARVYDRRYDILYQPERGVGEVELYDSKTHGFWPIRHTDTAANRWGLEVVNTGLSLPKPQTSRVPRKSSKASTKRAAVRRPKRPAGHQERLEYDGVSTQIPRNQDVIDWVKTIENSECQICGVTIESPDGSRSIDLHHIWPLGSPHNGYEHGYDRDDNAICLCPNHHREMHMGLFYIEPTTYRIVYHNTTNPNHNGILRRNQSHTLDDQFLFYHKSSFFDTWLQ